MRASFHQGRVVVPLTQAHVLLGSAAAFLLGGYASASGWFGWTSLFRSHPLLSIPCTLSLFAAPALLYICIRQMSKSSSRCGGVGAWAARSSDRKAGHCSAPQEGNHSVHEVDSGPGANWLFQGRQVGAKSLGSWPGQNQRRSTKSLCAA
jgi:hypothetical protein